MNSMRMMVIITMKLQDHSNMRLCISRTFFFRVLEKGKNPKLLDFSHISRGFIHFVHQCSCFHNTFPLIFTVFSHGTYGWQSRSVWEVRRWEAMPSCLILWYRKNESIYLPVGDTSTLLCRSTVYREEMLWVLRIWWQRQGWNSLMNSQSEKTPAPTK